MPARNATAKIHRMEIGHEMEIDKICWRRLLICETRHLLKRSENYFRLSMWIENKQKITNRRR